MRRKRIYSQKKDRLDLCMLRYEIYICLRHRNGALNFILPLLVDASVDPKPPNAGASPSSLPPVAGRLAGAGDCAPNNGGFSIAGAPNETGSVAAAASGFDAAGAAPNENAAGA